MEQHHVFDGFKYGEKDQRGLLANQIVSVNSKLLQQALQNIETPSTRPNLLQILSLVPRSNTLRIPGLPKSAGSGGHSDPYCKLQKQGQLLTSNGKVAICLVLEEIEETGNDSDVDLVPTVGSDKSCLHVKALLDDHLRFVKMEGRLSLPLVLVCPAHSVSSLRDLFSDSDCFAFDPEKVWFLEEERLPVVSSSPEGHSKHKILMKSPWEFLQRPMGSGGVISLLSSLDSFVDELSELGVEYIEVCKIDKRHGNGDVLLGLVDSCKANVGIRLFHDITSEEDFDVILSRKLMKQTNKFRSVSLLVPIHTSFVLQFTVAWMSSPSTKFVY